MRFKRVIVRFYVASTAKVAKNFLKVLVTSKLSLPFERHTQLNPHCALLSYNSLLNKLKLSSSFKFMKFQGAVKASTTEKC